LADGFRLKEVRWKDEVENLASAEHMTQQSTTYSGAKSRGLDLVEIKLLIASAELKKSEKTQKAAEEAPSYGNHKRNRSRRSVPKTPVIPTAFQSEADENGTDFWLSKSQREVTAHVKKTTLDPAAAPFLASAKDLLPTWVTPVKPQSRRWESPICIESGTITPMLNLTKEEKMDRLVRRLEEKFGPTILMHVDFPRGLRQYGGNDAADGIHVFVDSSNIVIGFYDALKLARGLETVACTKRAPISFHTLALILERGRGVARRVLVGSSNRNGQIPDYMREAKLCGYEVSSLDRVAKIKEVRSSVKKSRSGNGYGTSGQSSGSETPFPAMKKITEGMKKVTEQGVDEILHMKILESIVDAKEPTTIVLATGDAAEAEYSGGFLKNVERALAKGWKVELVAWGHSMSHSYRSKEFLAKWKNQFTIIELDDFSEELLESTITPIYDLKRRDTGPGNPFDEEPSSSTE
jgi:hypothetical protein